MRTFVLGKLAAEASLWMNTQESSGTLNTIPPNFPPIGRTYAETTMHTQIERAGTSRQFRRFATLRASPDAPTELVAAGPATPPSSAGGVVRRTPNLVGGSSGSARVSCPLMVLISSLCAASLAQAQAPAPGASAPQTPPSQSDMPPGYPSLDAPWTFGTDSKQKMILLAAESTPKEETPSPASAVQPPATETPTPSPAGEGTPPIQPRIRKNEVSASGDFFLGQGNVTMPFGFSLGQTLGSQNIQPTVAKPDRTSDYYGATLSYSYGQAFYIDLGYSQGSSSGNVDVQLGGTDQDKLPSAFTIKDDWYQAYLRYTFPGLRGKRLSAYLRAGVSYVTADLTDTTVIPSLGLYKQTDNTEDLLGNLGFGIGYSLYASRHVRLGLQAEGEGFYGRRTQKSLETLPQDLGVQFSTATINNDLYGGIGRFTARFEYRFGSSGAFKVFADGGIQARFTFVNYPNGLGTQNELLWGPYVKVGARYSF
jgi:hypothetical protein